MSTIRILLPLRKQITGYFDKPSLSLNRDSTNEFLSTFLKTYIEDIHDFHFIDEDPIDRGESSLSLDNKNTTYYEADASDEEMDITDGIEGIIGGTNRGHNGGGDGEALFIQISRLLMKYIKYYILNITHTYDAMPWWVSGIPWWMAESILTLLSLVCIHSILQFNPLIYKGNRCDIIYKVPDITLIGITNHITKEPIKQLQWLYSLTPDNYPTKWIYRLRNLFSYDENIPYRIGFLRIKCSLGLRSIKGLVLSDSVLYQYAHLGAGLKSLIPQSRVAIFMQVATRHFDERHRKYLYGFFNILVYSGVGLVVWYYITPHLIPDLGFFRGVNLDSFKDPASVVDGYKRVSYIFTKDVVKTVLRTCRNDTFFHNLLNEESIQFFDNEIISITDLNSNRHLNLDHFEEVEANKLDLVACIAVGIMSATFIATNLLPPGTTTIVQ